MSQGEKEEKIPQEGSNLQKEKKIKMKHNRVE
jgi:hypothetical protein